MNSSVPAAWHCMSEVRLGGKGQLVLETILTEGDSNFWTCSNDMVQVPTDQDRVAKQETRDLCTCWGRPAPVCTNEPVRVPKHYVYPRGYKPQEKAVQDIHRGSTEQLDGLALRAGCQLFIGSP